MEDNGMTARTRLLTGALFAVGVIGFLMTAADALTIDLSGIYDGKVICSGISGEDGTKEKQIEQDANVRVVQQGSALNVHFFNLGVHYNGQFVQDLTNPAKGTATFVSCQ